MLEQRTLLLGVLLAAALAAASFVYKFTDGDYCREMQEAFDTLGVTETNFDCNVLDNPWSHIFSGE